MGCLWVARIRTCHYSSHLQRYRPKEQKQSDMHFIQRETQMEILSKNTIQHDKKNL